MTQTTIWHRHEPVVSVFKDGTVIRFCKRCGARL
jgi:hypothetical protein